MNAAVKSDAENPIFETEEARFFARPMTALDRNAVFATWLPSARDVLKKENERFRPVSHSMFETHYPAFVEHLLNTQWTYCLYRVEAPGVPHGWACAGDGMLHWAYVPFNLRGVGLGRAIITRVLGGYPSRIYVTSPIDRRRSGRVVYNPYAMRAACP